MYVKAMLTLLVAVGLTVAVLLAAGGRSAGPAAPGQSGLEAYADADPRLDRRLARFKLDRVTFDEAVEALRKESGLDFVVDWAALDESASVFERDVVLDLDVTDVSVGDALRWVLRLASRSPELSYTIDGSVVTISTAAAVAERPVVRVYDVRDLVGELYWEPPVSEPDAPPAAPAASPAASPAVAPAAGTAGGGGLFGGAPDDVYEDERDRVTVLASVVDHVLAPLYANSAALDPASCGFGGRLIVVCPLEKHRAVAGLLARLRQNIRGAAPASVKAAQERTNDGHEGT